jgi:proteic killer suppression protein
MIRTFKDAKTQALFEGKTVKAFQAFRKVAERKLQMLDAAPSLPSLASPPGNQLEALKRDRQGQHSVRINDQWRVCFVWKADGPYEVEIVDYH